MAQAYATLFIAIVALLVASSAATLAYLCWVRLT